MAENTNANDSRSTRRQFVQAGIGLGTAGLAAFGAIDQLIAADTTAASTAAEGVIKPGNTILFQGDSITDAGRKRDVADANSATAMGEGYAWFTTAQMLVDSSSANLKFFNRGVSGNKVYQLAERWQADCLDLKPDVLSILIGVNDYWHTKSFGYKATLETYEHDLHALLKRTKDALPNIKFVVCEPFLLECGNVKPDWPGEFASYRKAAGRLAEEMQAVFVPFQAMFDAAVKIAPPATWAGDGVHPSASGAALMAHWWLKTVGT